MLLPFTFLSLDSIILLYVYLFIVFFLQNVQVDRIIDPGMRVTVQMTPSTNGKFGTMTRAACICVCVCMGVFVCLAGL